MAVTQRHTKHIIIMPVEELIIIHPQVFTVRAPKCRRGHRKFIGKNLLNNLKHLKIIFILGPLNTMDAALQTVLTSSLVQKIHESKLLLVGSGGIGCELLKNLSMSSFQNVTVIDLDTIDVSNLNRQFLFRKKHVGMAKCSVATAAVLSPTFNIADPGQMKYPFFLGNVKDNERFPLSFFQGFDAVLNALDNVDARRHVNRMCLAADVPLIEAGTTGYLGQVTVIQGKETECYECQPKPTQKVYPICTIRSTPSQPVHCIVWGKELFKLMFGKSEDSMLFEGAGEGDDQEEEEEEEEGQKEAEAEAVTEQSTFMGPVVDDRPNPNSNPNSNPSPNPSIIATYVTNSLTALFSTEVQKQLDMDRYKTATKTPKPLSPQILASAVAEGIHESNFPTSSQLDKDGTSEKRVWSVEENVRELAACTLEMFQGQGQGQGSVQALGSAAFDKDDHLSMRFVTAASNLRCHIFQIDESSLYTAKGIAGNIIPAIATTNAIVAGLQILELYKILGREEGQTVKDVCKVSERASERKRLLQPPTSTTKLTHPIRLLGAVHVLPEAQEQEGGIRPTHQGERAKQASLEEAENNTRDGIPRNCYRHNGYTH